MIAALRCFCLPAASSPNLVSCVLSLLYLILLLWTTFCVRFRGLIYCTVCLTHSLPFVLHRWIWSFVSLCDYCIGVLLPAAAAFEIWKQCSQTSEVRYPETRWFQEMLRRAYKVRVCVCMFVCLGFLSSLNMCESGVYSSFWFHLLTETHQGWDPHTNFVPYYVPVVIHGSYSCDQK